MAQNLEEFLASQGVKAPALAGLDVNVYQGDQKVGWATNMSFQIDGGLTPIKTLGQHGPIGFKSTDFNASMSIGALILEAGYTDNLETPWSKDDFKNLPPYDFKIMDVISDRVLFTLKKAVCGSGDVSFSEGQIVMKNTSWNFTDIIKGEIS